MTMNRREMMASGLGVGTGLVAGMAGPRLAEAKLPTQTHFASVIEFGATPDNGKDQTQLLQKAIDTTAGKAVLVLPPGSYDCKTLTLRPGSQIVGTPALSQLSALDGPLLHAEKTGSVRIEGLTLNGNSIAGAAQPQNAIALFNGVTDLRLSSCHIANSKGNGIALTNCAGRITDCDISDILLTGLFSLNATGLEISHNHVHACGNNGIQIWRNKPGEDASLVTHNRIEKIAALNGGSGQNGNGINIFRADAVTVMGNHITDCAFTAIRGNAASNCQMIGNTCLRLGEVALYAEFGFEGAVIANNLIDTAASGISVTNFNEGGRLAVVQGNLVRNLIGRNDPDPRGIGISAEADTAITGNVIENAKRIGIVLGWGKYLRDATAANNVIRNAPIGIGLASDFEASYVLVSNNFISGARDGGIRAMNHDKPLGRDLTKYSAESFRHFAIVGNVSV